VIRVVLGAAGVAGIPGPETDDPCEKGDGTFCGTLFQVTGSRVWGEIADALLGTPLRIVGICLGALLLRFLLFKAITHAAERVASGNAGLRKLDELPGAGAVLGGVSLRSQRTAQRARTLASVLRSITTGLVGVIAILMIMGELGYSLGPLLASAGIAGVAIGFGAQTLVRDFLSGVFMILEDQYGVGDAVDLGEASGHVESVGLRVTKVRDVEGTLWHVRNGEIVRVGNKSQGWARAVIDVTIAYTEDLERVKTMLLDVAHRVAADEEFAELVLEEPEMWGVESMTSDGIVLRLVAKTQPLQQWIVARELRRRIKERFDAEDVEIPLPQRTVWLSGEAAGNGGPGAREAREGPAAVRERATDGTSDAPDPTTTTPDNAAPAGRSGASDRPPGGSDRNDDHLGKGPT